MICCFGSLNIDIVYAVAHTVRPGETLAAGRPVTHAGGKGLNQTVALARAGETVAHAGKIGADGLFLRDLLEEAGADVSLVTVDDEVGTGHALIQVSPDGQNAILLYGGANRTITDADITRVLDGLTGDDLLLLQNELNDTARILEMARERGIPVALNLAPYSDDAWDLQGVAYLFVNETEGQGLTGQTAPEEILRRLGELCPGVSVLTLGTRGALAYADGCVYRTPCVSVTAVDTTGAGDTYTGYFLAGVREGMSVPAAMSLAAHASALQVTRPGAAEAIPTRAEVGAFMALRA